MLGVGELVRGEAAAMSLSCRPTGENAPALSSGQCPSADTPECLQGMGAEMRKTWSPGCYSPGRGPHETKL